jgi:hypothetical protein
MLNGAVSFVDVMDGLVAKTAHIRYAQGLCRRRLRGG